MFDIGSSEWKVGIVKCRPYLFEMLFDVKHSWILIWNLNKARIFIRWDILYNVINVVWLVFSTGIRNFSLNFSDSQQAYDMRQHTV